MKSRSHHPRHRYPNLTNIYLRLQFLCLLLAAFFGSHYFIDINTFFADACGKRPLQETEEEKEGGSLLSTYQLLLLLLQLLIILLPKVNNRPPRRNNWGYTQKKNAVSERRTMLEKEKRTAGFEELKKKIDRALKEFKDSSLKGASEQCEG